MTPEIIQAIAAGAPGVSVTITAADLREVIAEVYNSEKEKVAAMPDANEPPTLTRREVARLLNVAESTLWRWDNIDYLKPMKIGKKVLYRRSDVDKLLSAKR